MLGPQILGGLLQEKPKVPKFVPVDATVEQQKATADNISNFNQVKGLASDVNTFNFDQMQSMLRKAIPGYDDLLSKTRSIIDSELSGVIPDDVSAAVNRNSAVRALMGGYAGSGMHANLTARDLGLTSLQLTQQGLDSASKWIQTARQNIMPQMFDVTSMFLTPQQRIALATNERDSKFQRDWVGNQLNAEYSPGTIVGKAIIKTDDQITAMAASVAGSAAGGMMCWVAREVYGASNPKWIVFREWMLRDAPSWLRNLYVKHGAAFAEWVKDKPRIKSLIRRWMDRKIVGRTVIDGKVYSY